MAKFNRISFLFLILLQVSFFSLMTTSQRIFLVNSYVYKTLTIFLVFCLLGFNLIFNFYKTNQMRNYYFLPMILGWILIYLLTFWGSLLYYDQSLLTTIKNSYIYFMVALYFLLVLFFDSLKSFKFILNSFSIVGVIYATILIIQAFLEKVNFEFLDMGVYGLNPILDSYGPIFHLVRIAGPADFISFALLITIIKQIRFKNPRPVTNGLFIVIDFLYVVLVSGTRMYMIIDFLLIVFFILSLLKDKFPGILYSLLSLGMLFGAALVPFMAKMFVTGDRKLSFNIRQDEIKYYLGKVFHNDWFGIGFPDAKKYNQLLHGPSNSRIFMSNGKYYIEDVGAMGVVVIFGILGGIGLLWFAYKVIKAFQLSVYKDVMLAMILFLIMTTATLSLIDPQRIFYLFILIYIMEYCLKKVPQPKLEENK